MEKTDEVKKPKRKNKRIPPIAFPIWLIIASCYGIYRLVLWLIGYWHCPDCKKRYGLKDDRFRVLYDIPKLKKRQLVYKLGKKKVCENCKGDYDIENQATKQE